MELKYLDQLRTKEDKCCFFMIAKSLTYSRGSRVAGRGSKVAVAGPMSRSRVQSRGRGSNVAAGENDLGSEVTAE